MNKHLPKIIIFLIAGSVISFWIATFIFKINAPKSKAAGEVMALSFNPSSITAELNTDFTVGIMAKPSINTILRGYKTRINFDKNKLKLKTITYKTGQVIQDLGNTTADATTVNNAEFGQVNLVGEVISANLVASTAAELATLTFTNISTASGTVLLISDSAFYSVNSDATLNGSWTTTQENLTVNGGGAITIVPLPTATGTIMIEPSITSSPTLTPLPTPTGSTGNVNLNMKLKFQGITKQPATAQNSMNVKIKVYSEGVATPYEGNGTFTSGANGIWSGKIGVNITTVSGKYKIFVKGVQHLQKKICDSTPTEATSGVYRCATGNIPLVTGDNSLDFSGVILLVGDLDQSGLVDSVDFGLVRNNLGKSDATVLATSDLNRDGKVDTQDFSLIIAALGVRTDEL